MDAILCDRSPSFIVSLRFERGKSEVEAVCTNVLENGGGKLGGLLRLGVGGGWRVGTDAVSNFRGANLDVEAGEQVEGGLLAGGVAENVAAKVDLRFRRGRNFWGVVRRACLRG
jgi:hypothetical protein